MRLNSLLLIFFSCSLHATTNEELDRIQQRIQPEGQVHVQPGNEITLNDSADTHVVKEIKKDKGQTIYEQHCIVCHRDGLAGAPKLHNDTDWKPRLNGRTLEDLVASSIKGLNAMPARGTCPECSDQDLSAAIQYMLPKS